MFSKIDSDNHRIKYQNYDVVDGDTVNILVNGLQWGVRIYGLDTDEMTGKHKKRGEKQTSILEGFFKRTFKPKIYVLTTETRNGWRKIKTDGYGRWLAVISVFRWRSIGYIDYSEFMKNTNNIKKGSKWNF